jgi:NACalpha-BTF3-like transcription factor
LIRKHKASVHKAPKNDDKRLQSALKKIGLKPIPAIEEVNIFKDETVIHFANPMGMTFSFQFVLDSSDFLFFVLNSYSPCGN